MVHVGGFSEYGEYIRTLPLADVIRRMVR